MTPQKPQKNKNGLIYKPTYDIVRSDYERRIRDTGEEIEIIGFHRRDKMIIENPPDRAKLIDKLLGLIRGSGIAKITITMLNTNLSNKSR